HDARFGDPDGERRRWRLAVREPEEGAQRNARGLRRAVVSEDVEGARRGATVREVLVEPSLERREIGGILRHEIQSRAHLRLERLRRLLEERIRRRLATGDAPALREFDEHHSLLRAHRSRDLEGDLEMDVHGAHGEVHDVLVAAPRPRASMSARARRSAPAAPSRIGSAAGSLVTVDALWIQERARSGGSELSRSPVLRAIATTRAGG